MRYDVHPIYQHWKSGQTILERHYLIPLPEEIPRTECYTRALFELWDGALQCSAGMLQCSADMGSRTNLDVQFGKQNIPAEHGIKVGTWGFPTVHCQSQSGCTASVRFHHNYQKLVSYSIHTPIHTRTHQKAAETNGTIWQTTTAQNRPMPSLIFRPHYVSHIAAGSETNAEPMWRCCGDKHGRLGVVLTALQATSLPRIFSCHVIKG